MISWLVLALAAATSSPQAEAPPLMEAEAALRAGIHGKCIELARDAVKSGQLDAPALARAWLVRGRCHVLDGDAEKAERAYAVAVRIDPDVVLPTDDPIFSRVKPEGRAEATRLQLVTRAVVLGADAAPGTLVGVDALLQDDLGLAAAVVLIDDDDREVAAAPVTGPSTTLARVHRLSGFPVEGLRARLLDKAGNRLRIVDVEIDDDVRRALGVAGATPQPTTARPGVGTLAYVGAGVLGTGFALATVMGIQSAVALQADETRVIDDELPLVLGFSAGVVAFATGGALIVVERLQSASPPAPGVEAPAPAPSTAVPTSPTSPTSPAEAETPSGATSGPVEAPAAGAGP